MKIDSRITIDKGELSKREWQKLLTALTYQDNDEIEVMAYSYRSGRGVMEIPRGAWDMIPKHVSVTDLRSLPVMSKVAFTKKLDIEGYEGQTDAIRTMFEMQQGQVVAPPGRGKTEIGLAFAAAVKTRTLVIVHTADLFKQWVERAAVSVPEMEVGKIQGQSFKVGHLTIAMAQTLKRHVPDGGKFWRQFGAVLVDEGHHAAANTWEWILNVCPAYYRFGLTATDKRSDGRQASVRFNLGPVIYRIKFVSQVPLTVQPVRTGLGYRRTIYRGPFDWTRMLRILSADPERNQRIAEIALREMSGGHTVLVLSRQIKHLEHIHAEMERQLGEDFILPAKLLTGRSAQFLRDEMLDDLRSGAISCILATQLADEGLDVPRLDRILLTFPGKHDGRIIQQIGRGIRKYQDKTDTIVYDFVDDFIPPLARQYGERKATYKKLGIVVKDAIGYGTEKKPRRRKRKWQVQRSGR